MALRKIPCTAAAAALRSAAYSSPRSLLRRSATTDLLNSSIGSTKSYSLSYSTAAKSSPPQDTTYWKQLFRKVQLSVKTIKDDVLTTRGYQNIIDEGKCEALNNYGNDLTELARRGKLNPFLGRQDEIERCIQILSRETKNNPIILAETGKERTEIVEGLAHEIIFGDVFERLVNRKLISLDTGSLLAGTKSGEHFKQRLEAVLKEITDSNDQIIVFIDEIHTIVGSGGHNGAGDVGNLLDSMLGRGDLQIVGATTLCEYRKYIQDLDLDCRFHKILGENPTAVRLLSQWLGFFGRVLLS